MKNRKMVLWIALIVMAIIPVYAQQYNPESDFGIDWDSRIEGGVIITSYKGTKKEVSIPPSIQNNPVTTIAHTAFNHDRAITKVTIPNSVKIIESKYAEGYAGAFQDCTSLTSVTIGNNVTYIGAKAFSGCTSLTSITIPDSVTGIGDYAFSGCTRLTSITIPNSVTRINKGAFAKCTSLTRVTIPDSVTAIGGSMASYDDGTFEGCTSLTSVTIGNNVTSIGEKVFSGCTKLTNITIPNSVTRIDKSAFEDCASLASVTIPESVTSIGGAAFYDCTSLTSVTFQGWISSSNIRGFPGDLIDKYLADDGGPGTYKRFAGGEVWRKQ